MPNSKNILKNFDFIPLHPPVKKTLDERHIYMPFTQNLDKQRGTSSTVHKINIQVSPTGRSRENGKRPRRGRDDCLRAGQDKGGDASLSRPVNTITSKARAAIRWACNRRWQRRNRHELQGRENRHIPVPQGERGILWAWFGQLSHLPPPAVGITASVQPQTA